MKVKKFMKALLGITFLTLGITVVDEVKDYKVVDAAETLIATYEFSNGATLPTGFTNSGSTDKFATTKYALKANGAYVQNTNMGFPSNYSSIRAVVYGVTNGTSGGGTVTVNGVNSSGAIVNGAAATFTPYYATAQNAATVEKVSNANPREVSFTTSGISGLRFTLTNRAHNFVLHKIEVYADADASGGEITPVEPTLSLNESSATIYEGSTYQIEVTTNQDDVSFVSSATNIATVDENGLIRAISAGNANITVSAGDLTETFTVTVEAIPEDQKNDYVKVTRTPSNWEGEYLIVCESKSVAFDGSLTSLDGVGNKVDVTITDGKIAYSPYLDNMDFTIESISSGEYSIKSSSGYYIGQTSNANGLASNTSTKYANTLSVDSSGNASIKVSSGPTLKYNSASDQVRFRYYKSGQTAVSLYKKVDNTVVENEECKENVKTYNGFANLAYKYSVSEVTYDAGYRAVNNISAITDGAEVIVVSVGKDGKRYALTAASDGTPSNSLDSVEVTAENGSLTSYEGATSWTLTGNATDGFAIYSDEKYLKATTGGTNLTTDSTATNSYLSLNGESAVMYRYEEANGGYFKHYKVSNIGNYSASLELYVKYDTETAVKEYSNVEFRLQVGVNAAEMATLLASLPTGATYGLEISGNGKTEKVSQEKLSEKSSVEGTNTYNYVTVSLGDVMNNVDRAGVVFTVKVFVEYEEQVYYSDIEKTYTVEQMVKAYHDAGNTAVSGLYNYLSENGYYSVEEQA